jgi:hypothetical protein
MIDMSEGLSFSCWIKRRLDFRRLLRFCGFWLGRKYLLLFFELKCLTSPCIPYTPIMALTLSKQTEWISSFIRVRAMSRVSAMSRTVIVITCNV